MSLILEPGSELPCGKDPVGFDAVRRRLGCRGEDSFRAPTPRKRHKAEWVSRKACRLFELEADVAKLQAHLMQKR